MCSLLIVLGQLAAGFVPAPWQGNWSSHVVALQAHFVDRFYPFDAVWYQHIADDFYVWDPAQPSLKQDVAFFPLWPVVLRSVSKSVSSAHVARWMVVAVAACFEFAAVSAFHRLALRLLPAHAARIATYLFALWPGASFVLLSYPTGLINLLCILALLALMDRHYARAAICGGLVTAAGPLGLGTALTVCVCAAMHARSSAGTTAATRMRTLAWLCGVSLLSVSGLLGFLLLQYVKFGDPLAFIEAQSAWAAQLPRLQRAPRAMLQLLIVPDFVAAVREIGHATRAVSRVGLQASLEKGLYEAVEGAELVALLACTRLASRPLLLQGVFTMGLFIWFDSSSRPGHATLRLTYCVIGVFLGAAWLLRNRPRLAAVTICLSALLLLGGAFLTAAGYRVV